MKKEKSIAERLAGIGLAAAVSLSSNAAPNRHPEQLFQLRDNSPNMSVNEEPIKENVVFAANTETAPPTSTPSPASSPSLSPTPSFLASPTPTPEPTPTLSPAEKRQQKIRQDLVEINLILDANSNIFSDKYKADINLYYPIYKPVADKFKLDWYLLFIVHEKETGASAGKRGFAPDSYYVGAMQRDPNTWSESFVKQASRGLEYLKDLPQRHSDDWREIAAGAAILDRNVDHYISLGKKRAVLNALRLYTPGVGGYQRFELYKKYEKLFN